MPSIVDVVGDHLQAEVGHGVEALLRQENGTDAFRSLQVAKLERDELLEPVQVTIDSSVVPPSRYHKLNADVDVIIGGGKLEQLIVKLVEILAAVLIVKQQLAIGEFAGIRKHPNVLECPSEDEQTHADVIGQHDLHKSVEVLFVFGLEEGFGFELLGGRVEGFEVFVREAFAHYGFVCLEDEHLCAGMFDVLVDVLEDCHEVAALPWVLLCHLLQRIQEG